MFKHIFGLSVVMLCGVLFGCGGTTIEVSVDGQGVVTSSPEGIECGSGLTACKKTFSSSVESVSLLATVPSDGSYEFSRWEGGCNDDDVNCVLTEKTNLTAIFVSTDVLGNRPTRPNGMQVNAMGTAYFFVRWGSSSDLVTPESELIYRIYLAETPQGIVSQPNLVATVQGSGADKYDYDLNVEDSGIVSSTGEYTVAITAFDTDGYESEPLYISNQKLQEEELELRAGINLIDGIDAGFPTPTITEDDVGVYYEFEGVNANSLPSVNDVVAYPATDDGVDYHELMRVTEVVGDRFMSVVISPAEITSKPPRFTGSWVGGEVRETESVESSQDKIMQNSNGSDSRSQSVECEAEDVSKLSILAQSGIKTPQHDVDITLINNPMCISDPSSCFTGDDYVSVIVAAEPVLNVNVNMQGGECYQYEAVKPVYDKDLLRLEFLKKLRVRFGKIRMKIDLAYSVNGSSSAAIVMSNKLEIQNLEFKATITPDGPEVIAQTPKAVLTPNNTLEGSIDYTILLEPRVEINFAVTKAAGFDYEGKLSNTFNGAVSAKSLSGLTPEDVYLDRYSLDLQTRYIHTFTPYFYIGVDAIQDGVPYESDTLTVFSLPSAASEPIAESFDDDEMCRLTYAFADGANNPLDESPFSHYLLFNDSTEVSLGEPVSITKLDGVTSFVYEYSQQDLFDRYVSVAREKAYKRIARGTSRIGDTVVENTEFKNL